MDDKRTCKSCYYSTSTGCILGHDGWPDLPIAGCDDGTGEPGTDEFEDWSYPPEGD